MQKVQELRQSLSPSESHSYTLLIPLEWSSRLQANALYLYLKRSLLLIYFLISKESSSFKIVSAKLIALLNMCQVDLYIFLKWFPFATKSKVMRIEIPESILKGKLLNQYSSL